MVNVFGLRVRLKWHFLHGAAWVVIAAVWTLGALGALAGLIVAGGALSFLGWIAYTGSRALLGLA